MTPAGPLSTALLTWGYPPVPTGIGRAAEAIATGLARQGVRVRVFSADRPKGEREVVDGVEVIGCAVEPGAAGWLRRRGAIGHLAAPLAFRRALLEEQARAPFDLVESTNWYAPAALVPRGLPLVVRHSTPAALTASAVRGLRDRVDHAAAHRVERALVHRADHLVFNTAASEALLRVHYRLPAGPAASVIGLALPDATISAGRAAPLATGPLTLAFVGRAEPRKGFCEAIAAVAVLHAQGLPARLHVIGTDPGDVAAALARNGLPGGMAEAIVEHGRVDDGAMHAIFADSHMVLAPSRTESYGIVYREAAAFGRPLVAAREDASAREYVAATGAGVLAAHCGPDAIAAAVAALWHDPARRTQMRAAGLAHAATLTKDALGRATLAAYGTALDAFALRAGPRPPSPLDPTAKTW